MKISFNVLRVAYGLYTRSHGCFLIRRRRSNWLSKILRSLRWSVEWFGISDPRSLARASPSAHVCVCPLRCRLGKHYSSASFAHRPLIPLRSPFLCWEWWVFLSLRACLCTVGTKFFNKKKSMILKSDQEQKTSTKSLDGSVLWYTSSISGDFRLNFLLFLEFNSPINILRDT